MRFHGFSARMAISLAALLMGLAQLGLCQDAQNFSGLLNKDLVLQNDAGAMLGDLLFSRHKGKITGVKVLDDRERSLTVQVTYSDADLSKSKVLTGEVQGEDGKNLPVSPASPTSLSSASGTVQITLNLDSRVPENTTLQAKNLVLRIHGDGFKYDVAAIFSLPKKWSVSIHPENVTVDITPAPIGTIPATNPASGGTAPPKIFRPEIQTVLVAPVALRVTPAQPAPQAQPADSRTFVLPPGAPRVATPVRATPATSPAATTMMMTDASAVRMSQISNLKVLRPVSDVQGLPPAVTDKGGKGPSSDVFPLFTSLRAAPDAQLTASDLTTISSDLYRDSNPASGIFYYLPARYVLYWDADNGYGLRMLYGASVQAGSPASVTITARLTAAIDSAEVQLLTNLLHAALKDNFKELRPFPFSGSPAFSLKDDLRQFNVPAEKISIAAISDIAGDVDLSITTDTVTKENIETTLTQGLGLTGTATFTSAAAGEAQGFSRTIPVQVRITDPHSFGTRRWRRDETAHNTTPFPLKLKYLNFLTVGADGTPTVYSYDLKNTPVPPMAQVRIAGGPVAGWLDGSALKTWISFGVQENYPDGIAKAKQQWTMGVDSLSTATLSFTSLTPFADPGGIARILVDIRSKYFDSQARSSEIRTAALTKDNDTAQVGPVFLINRTGDQISRPDDPLFAYRLSLIRSDGTVLGPGNWTDGDRLETFIGSVQLRALLGGTPPTH